MKAVFLDRTSIEPTIDLTPIEQLVDELVCYPTTSPDEILARVSRCEIIITNKVVFDEALLMQLPQLRLICITATGTDIVDLKAAKKAGIAVTNVAGYSTKSVAQHVFAYLLNVVNRVQQNLAQNQTKPWQLSPIFCQIDGPIQELSGKTLGILGYGNLGQAVAKLAQAFGMKVLIAERNDQAAIRPGRVSFVEMLAAADVVTIHCPLTSNTRALFDHQVFAQMKAGSIFINTARGGIVNSQALAENLLSGHLSHAIIDVLEQEPPAASHPLLNGHIPNLSLSHHIAWGSFQAQKELIKGVGLNIAAFSKAEKLNRVD